MSKNAISLTTAYASDTPMARFLWAALVVLIGSALLTISAKIQVPFWPVPMTLQTMVVLLLGTLCGSRLAGATVAAYLLQGAAGLPVFATGGGLVYFTGPTGGYLLGFLAAAMIAGLPYARTGRLVPTAFTLFLATTTVYLLGAACSPSSPARTPQSPPVFCHSCPQKPSSWLRRSH